MLDRFCSRSLRQESSPPLQLQPGTNTCARISQLPIRRSAQSVSVQAALAMKTTGRSFWLRGMDLNHRPLGYEPNELPDCSTPHFDSSAAFSGRQTLVRSEEHTSELQS